MHDLPLKNQAIKYISVALPYHFCNLSFVISLENAKKKKIESQDFQILQFIVCGLQANLQMAPQIRSEHSQQVPKCQHIQNKNKNHSDLSQASIFGVVILVDIRD